MAQQKDLHEGQEVFLVYETKNPGYEFFSRYAYAAYVYALESDGVALNVTRHPEIKWVKYVDVYHTYEEARTVCNIRNAQEAHLRPVGKERD